MNCMGHYQEKRKEKKPTPNEHEDARLNSKLDLGLMREGRDLPGW